MGVVKQALFSEEYLLETMDTLFENHCFRLCMSTMKNNNCRFVLNGKIKGFISLDKLSYDVLKKKIKDFPMINETICQQGPNTTITFQKEGETLSVKYENKLSKLRVSIVELHNDDITDLKKFFDKMDKFDQRFLGKSVTDVPISLENYLTHHEKMIAQSKEEASQLSIDECDCSLNCTSQIF